MWRGQAGYCGLAGDRRRSWILSLVIAAVQVGVLLSFPDELKVFPGQTVDFDSGPFFTLVALPPASESESEEREAGSQDYHVELRFFRMAAAPTGVGPGRAGDVRHPGGHAVGILLSSSGLVVVRTSPVTAADGSQRYLLKKRVSSPGTSSWRRGRRRQSPRRVGEPDRKLRQAREAPPPSGPSERGGGAPLDDPVLAQDPAGRGVRHMLGVYLKDPAAGVGTLTFWDPVRAATGRSAT